MATNFYVSSVAHAAIAQWSATTAFTTGQYVRKLAAPTYGNSRVFKCTTAGTSGGSEPAWNNNLNATTNDGTVVWTQVAGKEAEQAAGNWKAAAGDVQSLLNSNPGAIDGYIFLSSDHVEAATSDPSFNSAVAYISVSRAGGSSLPPVAADYTTGALINSTGSGVGMSFHFKYAKGITFRAGTSTGNAFLTLRSRGNRTTHEDCRYELGNTNSGAVINLGQGETFPAYITLLNPVFKFANSGQGLVLNANDVLDITNMSVDTGGTSVTDLFKSSLSICWTNIRDTDLTGGGFTNVFTNGSTNPTKAEFNWINCKLPSGEPNIRWTQPWSGQSRMRLWSYENGGSLVSKFYLIDGLARLQTNTEAILSGGCSDGLNTYSWKVDGFTSTGGAAANTTDIDPFWLPPIWSYRTAVGAAKTVTIELICTSTLNGSNLWLDLDTLDTASSILATRHSGAESVRHLAAHTTLTTTTSDWTTGASARQNSHAYAFGDVYKAASNSTRLFICTVAGTSAGSEPGAVATAVDGTSFADGGATFVAANRYKITASITPATQGNVRAQLYYHLPAATAVMFVDPGMTLT